MSEKQDYKIVYVEDVGIEGIYILREEEYIAAKMCPLTSSKAKTHKKYHVWFKKNGISKSLTMDTVQEAGALLCDLFPIKRSEFDEITLAFARRGKEAPASLYPSHDKKLKAS